MQNRSGLIAENSSKKIGIFSKVAEGKHLSPPREKFGNHPLTATEQKILKSTILLISFVIFSLTIR